MQKGSSAAKKKYQESEKEPQRKDQHVGQPVGQPGGQPTDSYEGSFGDGRRNFNDENKEEKDVSDARHDAQDPQTETVRDKGRYSDTESQAVSSIGKRGEEKIQEPNDTPHKGEEYYVRNIADRK